MHGFAADRHADHAVAIHQQPVDTRAFAQDGPQVDRGPSERLGEGERQNLVVVRIEERRVYGGMQGRLEIERRGAVEPGDRNPVVDLPDAVRPQLRFLLFLQGHVQQRSRSVADIHAGPLADLGRQRGEEAGALVLERDQGRRGRTVGVELDHAGGGSGRLAPDSAPVEDHDLEAGLCQLVGDRGPYRTRPNDDHIRAHEPDVI